MMPTNNLDIYRSAKLLIDQHGEHAVIEAAMRADELLAPGDLDVGDQGRGGRASAGAAGGW